MQKVKEDLGQLRSYVQSVVATTASPVDAAAMVKSAFMSIRKPTTRNVPELSAKNADVSGQGDPRRQVPGILGGVLMGVQPRPVDVDPHSRDDEGPDGGVGLDAA
jgi:hypothetical protein